MIMRDYASIITAHLHTSTLVCKNMHVFGGNTWQWQWSAPWQVSSLPWTWKISDAKPRSIWNQLEIVVPALHSFAMLSSIQGMGPNN
jgi:hypothetical protein